MTSTRQHSDLIDAAGLEHSVGVLTRAEPRFAAVVRRHGPPPLWAREPGFATLVLIMLEQQVSLAQARAIYARLARAAGEITPRNIAQLGTSGLRAIGVTRQKSAYLAALANDLIAGALDLDALAALPDAEVTRVLLGLHGVGPWTSQVYLLFALRRPDAFPAGDLALMEAVRQLWRLRARPSPQALERRAEAWRPHRAVAARLLWHHYLSKRAKGQQGPGQQGPGQQGPGQQGPGQQGPGQQGPG